MRNVALDLGANNISYCEVQGGKVVVRTTVRSINDLQDLLGPEQPKARVVFEACREAWHVHDWLENMGHEPLMLDTTRTRQLGIGHHGRKTDRLDAEALARALEAGRLPLAHVLSPSRRKLRYHLAARKALVETRAQWVSTVRGLVRGQGLSVSACAVEYFLRAIELAELDEETRALVQPLIALFEPLNVQIAAVENRLLDLCAEEPVIKQLATVPGVGLIVAAAFVSVIDQAGRFRNAHQVESYLGLVPSEDTSGGPKKRKLGSITKKGNAYLRALLVQASWSIMRQKNDADPLKQWGLAIAQRRGKRIAVVALSRRLAGTLWAMWRDDTVYDPARLGLASARGLARAAQSTSMRAEALRKAMKKIRRPAPAKKQTAVAA